MDIFEAMNLIHHQIKSIDPVNASRILGYILLQCHNDQVLIDFTQVSQFVLEDVISIAKSRLGLSSNTLPAPKNPQHSNLFAHFPEKVSPTSFPSSSNGPNPNSLSRFRDSNVGNGDCSNNIGGIVFGDRLGAGFPFLDDPAWKNEGILDRHFHRAELQRIGESSVALMGDGAQKFGQFQPERNESLAMATEEKATHASRCIFLKFHPNRSFNVNDVSNYFSTFGPVKDVRLPYNRSCGFVEFVHSETVKLVLSGPKRHYICSSRVVVKPYVEKEKVSDK